MSSCPPIPPGYLTLYFSRVRSHQRRLLGADQPPISTPPIFALCAFVRPVLGALVAALNVRYERMKTAEAFCAAPTERVRAVECDILLLNPSRSLGCEANVAAVAAAAAVAWLTHVAARRLGKGCLTARHRDLPPSAKLARQDCELRCLDLAHPAPAGVRGVEGACKVSLQTFLAEKPSPLLYIVSSSSLCLYRTGV